MANLQKSNDMMHETSDSASDLLWNTASENYKVNLL